MEKKTNKAKLEFHISEKTTVFIQNLYILVNFFWQIQFLSKICTF